MTKIFAKITHFNGRNHFSVSIFSAMMRYRFRELSVPISKQDDIPLLLARTLRVDIGEIKNLEVERYSLDARKRNHPKYSYTLAFDCSRKLSPKSGAIPFTELPENTRDPLENSLSLPKHIHVVGAGPAGLWAAYTLLKRGFSVVLHEQGKPVAERFRDIRRFFSDRQFRPHSNVLFGEGGAGAFSDGKLNTRTRNFFTMNVLKDMVDCRMPKEILTYAKPHLGTDRLSILLKEIRERIVALGGEFRFNSVLEDIEIKNREIRKSKFSGVWEDTPALVLATGHSARDTYTLLHQHGVLLESKAFAMGVRVEHPQKLINERQLGKDVDPRITGSAEYALTTKTLNNTSAAYSFCMCPGGVLVPCVSEKETLATNGMSHSHRRGPYANGAIVVPIPASETLFGGLQKQRALEQAAFENGGKDYSAPAQTIKAFLEERIDSSPLPNSTYPCKLVASNLHDWLDSEISNSLMEGFLNFERKIPGFIQEGLIVAPETRTSSPLRIPRNPETMESLNTRGLFVLGEGAGYSGGIVTSAADGMKFAYRAKLSEKI